MESTSIGSFTVQSVPDSVKVNDEQPPWITVQLSQDGNGMLCFSKATSIEAYVEEVADYEHPPEDDSSFDEGRSNRSKPEVIRDDTPEVITRDDPDGQTRDTGLEMLGRCIEMPLSADSSR